MAQHQYRTLVQRQRPYGISRDTRYPPLAPSGRNFVLQGTSPQAHVHLVRKPPAKATRRGKLTTDEVRRLLVACREVRLGGIIVLAVTMGLRQGEILGLRWEDVDLEAGFIEVSGALAQQERSYAARRRRLTARAVCCACRGWRLTRRAGVARPNPRSACGPVRAALKRDLSSRVTRQLGLRAAIGGTHITSDVLAPLLAAGGIPRRRLHDRRHTYAATDLRQRVPLKVVSAGLDTPGSPSRPISTSRRRVRKVMMAEAIDALYRDP